MSLKPLLLTVVFATAACVHNVRRDDDSAAAERKILDVEHGWASAMVRGDADGLESFFADDFVELGPSGRFAEKVTAASSLRAGTVHYKAIDLHDLRVRFPRPDVAVVTGSYSETIVVESTEITRQASYIDTWVSTTRGWKLVSSATVRPSASKP